MRSIQLQSALLPLHYSQPKHMTKQLQTPKPCLLSNEPIRLLGTSQRQRFSHLQGQTKAMLSSSGGGGGGGNHLALGLASPAANSPDVSTFILISVLLFVFYFISNFIVPDLISKNYQFDEDENREGGDGNDVERRDETRG